MDSIPDQHTPSYSSTAEQTPPAEQTIAPPPAYPAPAGKADIGKRFVAALIDGVLSSVVGMVIPVVGGLVGAAYMLVRDGLDVDFMKERSLGKQFMKLRPVRTDGKPMDIATSVRRNIPFAIGPLIMVIPILGWVVGPIVALAIAAIEVVLIVTDPEGRRLGDKFADTKVIEVAE